jgi:hypothetical protein
LQELEVHANRKPNTNEYVMGVGIEEVVYDHDMKVKPLKTVNI